MSQDFATNNEMITAAFKREFHTAFETKARTTKSALQVLVKDRGAIGGSSFTVNDMGDLKMKEMTTRFQKTEWEVPEAGTRLAVMKDFGLFVPVDPRDEAKLSANPTSEYMQACLSAEFDERDNTIIKALGASVQRKTKDGEDYTPTPLPASQIISAGGQPVNKAKIVKARGLMRKTKMDKRGPLYAIYNSEMLEQILIDDELTKWDRETIQNIQDGDVAQKWAGFIWLPYEELPNGAGGATEGRSYFTASNAVHFGRNTISNFDIAVRPDMSNVKQIGGITSYGAARSLEECVIALDFVR
ncbi:phage capsid protein [Acinetobacter colistiniresistens]|uniref:phage capsid protein n=1 Tax=Acinetobacter colistiniresistens TaxID=280145 RepID=UPI001250BA29|nr:phage capsid protein [Acinetobacter colistiniresistens]